MLGRTCLPAKALVAGLTLLLAAALMADEAETKPKKGSKDPKGTSLYMGQLRALFDAWDTNKDGYLDKEELAVAFRGAGARPYDYKKESSEKDRDADKDSEKDKGTKKAPNYSRYPDYNFLVQLDVDRDQKISRDEFTAWARDYAVQLKKQAAEQKKLQDLQRRLARARPMSRTYGRLQAQLRKQRAAIQRMEREMRAFERSVNRALKRR